MKRNNLTLEQLNAIVEELARTTPVLIARIKREARAAGFSTTREYLQHSADLQKRDKKKSR